MTETDVRVAVDGQVLKQQDSSPWDLVGDADDGVYAGAVPLTAQQRLLIEASSDQNLVYEVLVNGDAVNSPVLSALMNPSLTWTVRLQEGGPYVAALVVSGIERQNHGIGWRIVLEVASS